MIDADGSIRFVKNRPYVAVYNTNVSLMNWLIHNVGGKISGKDRRGREATYQWKIGAANDVFNLCTALLPILIVKKLDAEKAINHLKNKYGKRIKNSMD